MGGMIHLQAEGGIPIGMTLPLHATITEQWKNGTLKRVTPDGEPWEGDEFDLTGPDAQAPADTGADADGDDEADGGDGESGTQEPAGDDPWDAGPPRPADSAPKAAWQAYAVALGAASEEEAAGMTRAALIKLCTPPEADPLAEG